MEKIDNRCEKGLLRSHVGARVPGSYCKDDSRFDESIDLNEEDRKKMKFFDTQKKEFFIIDNCKVNHSDLICDILPGQNLKRVKEIVEK